MVSAYAVRKLSEARLVSDELEERRWTIHRHKLRGEPPDIWNRYFFWETFDLESSTKESMTTVRLCNQIIHSWIWTTDFSEAGSFRGIYVASDRERRKCLYRVEIEVLIRLFDAVGREEIGSMTMATDANGERQWVQVKAMSPDELARITGEVAPFAGGAAGAGLDLK